eukprot:CAMPEP_0179108594 /NCGR_PEP_ID=MMETSP0796-20121207/50590_1 /TAXON_ID=73915 /ORGANISM="Pyrodinium bahamense, Strain pbaha01" /LENGTH=162 /DNA_ID=CAMNT_0020806669 /DNA_START=112 /DNA_END=601 /DNA_ORIENTATION=+
MTRADLTLSAGACRGFANGGGGGPGRQRARQAHLAKAYLREYVRAKNQGDIIEAMRLLEKATVAAQHVHVWIPNQHMGGRSLVPLSAIVPSFSCHEDEDPRFVLPVSVDSRGHLEEEAPPLPPGAGASPMPLVLPFDPNLQAASSDRLAGGGGFNVVALRGA